MEVISDAAFDVTFVLLAPATVPLTEIVSDRSLFCTGSTSTVFTAIATCLVALCMDIPIQTTRTATITSTTISTFFFFFGFAAIAPAFCSVFLLLVFHSRLSLTCILQIYGDCIIITPQKKWV